MPGAYEVDQVGQKQEISNMVFNARAPQTPFTSLVPKGKKPAQKISTWQTKSITDGSLDGVADGADVTEFGHEPREELTGISQKQREPWMVSDFADVTDVAGIKSEKAEQKATATVKLKYKMEGRYLSLLECAKEPAADTNLMRGAGLWLSPTAQTLYPVPEEFRPSADCTYDGTLANLTEAEFENLVIAAYLATDHAVDIDMFTGVLAQRVIDNFTVRDTDGAANLYPVRSFTQDAKSKKMIKVVSVLEFSYGTVRCHPSTFLFKNLDGTASDRTSRGFLGLNLRMWELGFMRKPRMVDLQDQGGGPRGFADVISVIKCRNPLGQFRGLSES